MNGKFFDLKKEKQDRMINAALKCFGLQGYQHGSTDEIVKEAAISKGLLFHYFGSKLGTYRFILDYSIRFMKLELRTYVDTKETDLFEIIKQVEGARTRVMKGYPYMQYFLNQTAYETAEDVQEILADKKIALEETYKTIYDQIDYSSFPAGVDGEKVRTMLEYTIQGLLSEYFRKEDADPDALYREICEYVNMTRRMIMK